MSARLRRGAFACAVVAWAGACIDDGLSPVLPPPPPVATVSNPINAPAAMRHARVSSTIGSSNSSVVFVSLQPGTVPGGGLATIRNTRSGFVVSAAMADGGFDPTATEAVAGDTLAIEVLLDGGGDSLLLMTVPVSRRPRVVRTNPSRGKRDVPLNASMIIVFSEPINPGNAGAIQLQRGGAPVSAGVAVSPDGLRAELTPAGTLSDGTDYEIVIAAGVADLDGETLEESVAVPFTTGTTAAVASVATDPVALFVRPGTGELRSFDMSTTLHDDGRITGAFNIFYPQAARRTFGRITCFTIVGDTAWVGGTIEGTTADVAYIGAHAVWLAADHGAPGGSSPDRLSLVTLDHPPAVDAPAFCASRSPVYPMFAIESGDVVINRFGPPPPRPGPPLSQIAYAVVPDGGLEVINADGTGGRALTSGPGDFNPSWSPDGTHLAFQSEAGQPGSWDIMVIRTDRSGLTRLTSGPDNDQDPAWSPDGARIAFVRNGSIHVMNADGTGVTPLSNAGNDSTPHWSPDGARIVFASSRSGTTALHVMNADGSAVQQLTSAAADYAPTWSPDGSLIAFNRLTRDSSEGTYIINADGSGLRRLTWGIRGHSSWSPDGTRLVYESFGMNLINADGTGILKIGGAHNPAWSPIGTTPSALVPYRSVVLAGGDRQFGTPGTTLSQPLRVRVVHDDGTPQPGVTIQWQVLGLPLPGMAQVSSHFATTDSAGMASMQLTLGGVVGEVRVWAALTDGTARSGEVVFTATATPLPPGPPVTICCDYIVGLVETGSVIGLIAQVEDNRGNTVAGVPITWTLFNALGTISPSVDTTRYRNNAAWAGSEVQLTVDRGAVGTGSIDGEFVVHATAHTIAGAPRVMMAGIAVSAIVNLWYGEFSPDSVVVPSGRTVAWTWDAAYEDNIGGHNIAFDDASTQYGGFFTRTFTGGPRTIRFRCALHTNSFSDATGEVGRVIIR